MIVHFSFLRPFFSGGSFLGVVRGRVLLRPFFFRSPLLPPSKVVVSLLLSGAPTVKLRCSLLLDLPDRRSSDNRDPSFATLFCLLPSSLIGGRVSDKRPIIIMCQLFSQREKKRVYLFAAYFVRRWWSNRRCHAQEGGILPSVHRWRSPWWVADSPCPDPSSTRMRCWPRIRPLASDTSPWCSEPFASSRSGQRSFCISPPPTRTSSSQRSASPSNSASTPIDSGEWCCAPHVLARSYLSACLVLQNILEEPCLGSLVGEPHRLFCEMQRTLRIERRKRRERRHSLQVASFFLEA